MHVVKMRSTFVLLAFITAVLFANGLEEAYGPGDKWLGEGIKTLKVTNTTNKQWTLDGVRFTSENIKGMSINPTYPAKDWKNVDDGNGPDRYQFRIPPGGNAANRLKPGASITSSFNLYQWGFSEDWTPYERQFMVKTGTFAKDKGYKDIKGVTVHYLDSISKLPWFYDPNKYYPDSLGIHGGKYSGGFIDTWYDQLGDSAIWQVQIGLPEKATKNQWLWNEWNRYNPGIMGEETGSGAYAGKGPNYSMALIMAQDYMNVDMQLLAGIGTKESNAGIEGGAANTGAPNGNSKYKTYNTDGELGTNHYIATSYASYILDPYPKFFPNHTGSDDASRFYINTPGHGTGSSGNTMGNSPQVSNVVLINTLYMWYGFELLFNATEWWAAKIFETANDKELAAKLYAWGWNKGFNSGWMNPMLDPTTINKTPAEIDAITPDYCWGVFHSINEMKKANRTSTTNGGSAEIYDNAITRNQVEEFFFGTGGDGDAGTLGTGGILWHFDHDDAKRQEIWKDVNDAFDILKGRAPTAGLGADEISVRYDWLGVLRVAKLHLDLDRPIPNGLEFINWVKQYSDTNVIPVDSIVVENNYPFVVKKSQNTDGTTGDVTLKMYAKDDYMLRNDSLGDAVSWTLDSNWGSWNNVTRDGGTKDSAAFTITIPRSAIVSAFGDGVSSGTGQGIAWFRVDDRNFNTIVDTFFVSVDVTPTPTLDSAIAVDTKGDGMADRIDAYLTKPTGFDLTKHSNLMYSWPDKLNAKTPTNVGLSGDVLQITDGPMTGGAGTGQIEFDYPGKSGYKEDVNDRVGPAMVTATLTITDAGRDRDTLVITTTEPLKNSHANNTKYLFLNAGNQVNSENVIRISDTEWQFIFPKNEVVDKDSTKFVFSGTTVSDTVNNKPLDINRWVKINVVGGQEPTFDKSYIMDTDGDGLGDSIYVALTLGEAVDKFTVSDIDSGTFSWPTQSLNEKLNTGAFLDKSDKAFSFLYASTAGAGLGRISMHFPGYECSGDIADSVGPAITKATFSMADAGRTKDTLVITTSEPLVNPAGSTKEFLFLNKDNKEVSSEVLKVSTTEWLFLFTVGTVVDKDSVKFTYAGETVADTVNNTPLDINQWIKIEKSGGKELTYKKAFIKDTDGDGDGDSIRVTLSTGEAPDHYTVTDLDSGRYSWPTDALDRVLQSSSFTEVDDSSFSFIYNSTDGEGTGKVSLNFPDNILTEGVIEDSVGPVIKTATLSIHDANRANDTLVLIVSEALTKTDKKAHGYLFLNENLKESSDSVISKGATEYWFILPKGLAASRDSVKFTYETDPVEDSKSNKPMDINQWVQINIVGGLEPALDTAFITDTDGDGDGDSVKVTLSLGAAKEKYTVDSLVDGNFSWPDILLGNALVSTNFLDKSDNSFSFLYDSDQGEGTGKISMNFPGDYTLNGEIQDAVGPVIKTATLFIQDSNRDRDTLIITTSEALTESDKTNHAYLFLNENLKENSEAVIKKSDTEFWFIFPKDLVFNRDSVKFTYDNNPVKDAVGNAPMDINQWVQIQVFGGREPALDTAFIVDTDGNGDGDSIVVELLLGAAKDRFTVDSISDGRFSWPGNALNNKVDPLAFTEKDDKSFSFLYNSDKGVGTGALELQFPEDYTLKGAISDAVGPVIDSAICLQIDVNRDADTLILETSEILKDNFNKDTKYLILFEDSANTDGDTISIAEVTQDSDRYRFIIAKNAVSYGDWVQFVYNSGITDTVDNSPMEINQKVLINVKGAVAPSVTTAAIFDVKGANSRIDGNGDSIYVALALSVDPLALTVDSLDAVEYTWNSITKTVKRDALTIINDSTFTFVDETLTGGSGTGTLTMKFINDDYSVTDNLNDSVAPVISSATYYNWSGVKDTLIVTFSEEPSNTGSDRPFLTESPTIQVQRITKNGTAVTYSVESSNELVYGDSIWIKGNEDIDDSKGNEQDTDMNIKVPLNYFRVTTLSSASYVESDERPDGYIDQILLTFDSEIAKGLESKLQDAFTLPSERSFSINGVDKIDDNRIAIEVSQATDKVEALTSCESYDKLSLKYVTTGDTLVFASAGDITILDSLAPVIVSARFIPAEEENAGEKLMDTLRVTYSEEVKKITENEPFRFSDASDGNSEYSLVFEGDANGKTSVTYLNEYKQANILPGLGDSIWIYADGEIEDEFGQRQQKNTIPVPLTVGNYKRDYKVSISPTPFNNAYYEDSVVTIRIQPGTRVLPDDIQAEFVILDKVGNEILKVSKSEFGDVEDNMLSYAFQPNNNLNRKLGAGSYAVQLYITADGISQLWPLSLAIQESDAVEENN